VYNVYWKIDIFLDPNVQASEMFEDTKGVIRSRNRKGTDNTMAKGKRTNGQTTIYKTLHRKLKIKIHCSNLF
jgi:hypothetical protein